VFLRKLKPSLVAARLRGEAPTDGQVTRAVNPLPPPPNDSESPSPPKEKSSKGGPNAVVVAAAAFAVGILAAKFIDWRGHAHPRD
jgi:hypothetical protein